MLEGWLFASCIWGHPYYTCIQIGRCRLYERRMSLLDARKVVGGGVAGSGVKIYGGGG